MLKRIGAALTPMRYRDSLRSLLAGRVLREFACGKFSFFIFFFLGKRTRNIEIDGMLAARHRARLAMADKNPDSQEAKLKSVRRRLNFGDTNDDNSSSREELERKFEEERSRHLEEKKAKWNFDFKEEQPLAGRWEWERVEAPKSGLATEPNASGDSDVNGDAKTQAH